MMAVSFDNIGSGNTGFTPFRNPYDGMREAMKDSQKTVNMLFADQRALQDANYKNQVKQTTDSILAGIQSGEIQDMSQVPPEALLNADGKAINDALVARQAAIDTQTQRDRMYANDSARLAMEADRIAASNKREDRLAASAGYQDEVNQLKVKQIKRGINKEEEAKTFKGAMVNMSDEQLNAKLTSINPLISTLAKDELTNRAAATKAAIEEAKTKSAEGDTTGDTTLEEVATKLSPKYKDKVNEISPTDAYNAVKKAKEEELKTGSSLNRGWQHVKNAVTRIPIVADVNRLINEIDEVSATPAEATVTGYTEAISALNNTLDNTPRSNTAKRANIKKKITELNFKLKYLQEGESSIVDKALIKKQKELYKAIGSSNIFRTK